MVSGWLLANAKGGIVIQFSQGFLNSIVKYAEQSVAHSSSALNIIDLEIDKATMILEKIQEAKSKVLLVHSKNSGQGELTIEEE